MTTTHPTPTPAPSTPPAPADVLQSDHHSRFTTAEIAKAVARHKREHGDHAPNPKPQKTTPRG
ncbi:MAG: hypothetical protein WBD46_18285 [Acidobacteriaceae bacterium]